MSHPPRLAPVISLSHGGGPMPLLGDPTQAALTHSMRTRVPQILGLDTARAPRAIVVVTAHWSTEVATVSSGARPALYYDYGGFPAEAYRLKYGAPGSPEVAGMVVEALRAKGIACEKDDTRGWDHGVFVPLTLIHPAASIPIIQLSVLASPSPSAHFALGQALAPLRAHNIAIVGSGFASLHNLRALFSGQAQTPAFREKSRKFAARLREAVEEGDAERQREKFEAWRGWEGSVEMHPRGGEEHFWPLVVCAGAGAGDAKKDGGEGRDEKVRWYTDEFMGMDMWSFYWGGEGVE